MPTTRKQKSRRAPFIMTVATAAAAVISPGCGGTVITGNPNQDCPTAEPAVGSSCSSAGLECKYEVNQGCGPETDIATCDGAKWSIQWGGGTCNPPPPPPECPTVQPSPGSPCDFAGLECKFTEDYGCGPETNTATCDGAVWTIQWGGGTCNPPPPDYCTWNKTEAECQTDPNCRWLVPGCGMPALPAAGCFPVKDCVGDFDCQVSGGTCSQVIIDPCYKQACDACGAPVSVCVPPAMP